MFHSFARAIAVVVLVLVAASAAVLSGQAPASSQADLTGKWALTLHGSQGTIDLNLVLKQTGQAVSGTLGELHELTLEVEGTWRENTLAFTAAGEGHGQAITLEFAGALASDGTLGGRATTAMGEMTWKAKRDMK